MSIILASTWFWLAIVIGLSMIVISFWLERRLEILRCRNLPPANKQNYPPAAIVMALKGIDPGLKENLLAVLAQDHPDLEYVFAVESSDDPAYEFLNVLIAEVRADQPDLKIQLVVAGINTNRAQNITNQLAGLKVIRDEAEHLIILDSDIRPKKEYIRYLLEPFKNPDIGATSGYRWYQPDRLSFSGLLCSTWNAGAYPAIAHPDLGFCWGGTMAIRRDVYDRGDVAKAWENSVSNDLALTRVVKSLGYKVRYVPHCVPITHESPTLPEVLEFTSRQMLILRVYHPVMWWAMTLSHGLVAFVLVYGLASLALWLATGREPFLSGAAGLALLPPFFLAIYRLINIGIEWIPEVSESLTQRRWLYVLISPLASILSTRNSLLNIFSRTITWRGIKYELVSTNKTIVTRPGDISLDDRQQISH